MKEVLPNNSYVNNDGDIMPPDAAVWHELPSETAEVTAEDYELAAEAEYDSMIAAEEAEQEVLAAAYEAAEQARLDAPQDELDRRIEDLVDKRGISYADAAAELTGQRPEAPARSIATAHTATRVASQWGVRPDLPPSSPETPPEAKTRHSDTPLADAIDARQLDGLTGKERIAAKARQLARKEKRHRIAGDPHNPGKITIKKRR